LSYGAACDAVFGMYVPIYQTIRLHIPEDHRIDIYGRENLKSHVTHSTELLAFLVIFFSDNMNYQDKF
jgi:hypothetical protein